MKWSRVPDMDLVDHGSRQKSEADTRRWRDSHSSERKRQEGMPGTTNRLPWTFKDLPINSNIFKSLQEIFLLRYEYRIAIR
jgi:hypothetical protein